MRRFRRARFSFGPHQQEDTMTTRDLVLRASFWHDQSIQKMEHREKLELLRLYSHTDRDGIVLLDSRFLHFQDAAMEKLVDAGHIAIYLAPDGNRYAWVTRSGEQPTRGALACASYALPPPSRDLVRATLSLLLSRRATTAEARRASPRAFGSKRSKASGIVSRDVERVFDSWKKHQREPSRCRLGAGAKRMIEPALRESDVDSLCDFIEYAYTSDDAGPRYWRGENPSQRTYLGLDNLLRITRIAGRIEAMRAFTAKQGDVKSESGTTLGPLAAYRRRGPIGTVSTSPDGAERLSAQCCEILALFRERGEKGVTTSELAKIGRRYGARLSELRGAGFDVYLAQRSSDGNNLYMLNEPHSTDEGSSNDS